MLKLGKALDAGVLVSLALFRTEPGDCSGDWRRRDATDDELEKMGMADILKNIFQC